LVSGSHIDLNRRSAPGLEDLTDEMAIHEPGNRLENDFLLPLLYLQNKFYRDLNLAFAYAVMGIIPIVGFFLLMQKYIIKGIAAGAIKG
jgi:hypothetical protein